MEQWYILNYASKASKICTNSIYFLWVLRLIKCKTKQNYFEKFLAMGLDHLKNIFFACVKFGAWQIIRGVIDHRIATKRLHNITMQQKSYTGVALLLSWLSKQTDLYLLVYRLDNGKYRTPIGVLCQWQKGKHALSFNFRQSQLLIK